MKVIEKEAITLEIGGAQVRIPAQTLADLWIERITRGAAAVFPRSSLPRIGEVWPGQGGIFLGIARGRDGSPDYPLIMAPDEKTKLEWQPSVDWAAGLAVDGHKDFRLPTRPEQHLMIASAKDLFAAEWYWSGEQYAPGTDYAWAQGFDGGDQGDCRKGNAFRARAVRSGPALAI